MPNEFAYIALILWPLVSFVLYKRLPIVEATFWTIVGGFLLLPVKVAIDFPFIPPLDKESIPVIAALIGCRYVKKVKIRLLPKEGIEKWLIIVLLVTPFFTMLNNQETYNFIPGLTLHDTFSAIISQYLFVLPLIIGMQVIKKYEDQILMFKLLVIAALFYSIPILFEVRMSPQLHTWIYGFFPHSWTQQYRFGGFRPVVFMGHGLIVAMFIAISLGASAILLKEKIKSYGVTPWFVFIYFFGLLVLSKSVAAIVLGAFLGLAIIWLPLYIIKRLSVFIIIIVITYPFLSIFELFPHEQLVRLAMDLDPARGESLAFRFFNENLLLEHAQKKIFFGWGSWGRYRLAGSVTDGYWIITLASYGVLGFISLFGLPVIIVLKATKYSNFIINKNEKRLLLYHALIVSIIMIDQLPNASLSSWLFFIIGALLGRTTNIRNRNAI